MLVIWPRNSTRNSRPTNLPWCCCKAAHRYILDVRDKRKLTQELINLIPGDQQPTVESIFPVWWYNLRKNGGMRLTATGYTTLVNTLDLEHYEYTIDDPITFNQQTILDLDRKLQMPYYIHAVKGVVRKIIFFGSKEAMMANLYGNLGRFLENCK
jgi:hypothetical protein